MKRFFSLFLAALLLTGLCACGTEALPPAPAADAGIAAAGEVSAPVSEPKKDPAEKMLALLWDKLSQFKDNPEYEAYWFCVTDLDRNGLLELIAAVTEGTGSFTTALMFQVNEDGTAAEPVDTGAVSEGCMPEIILSNVDTYRTGDGRRSYIFFDNAGMDSETHLQTLTAMCLQQGRLTVTPLGYLDVTVKGKKFIDRTESAYTDAEGTLLSGEEEYLDLPLRYFAGSDYFVTTFDWFQLNEADTIERLAESRRAFNGEQESQPEQPADDVSEAAPARAPVVTLQPEAHTVTAGGSCSFTAQAENSTGVCWKVKDISGNEYDAFATPLAGQLVVSGVYSETLTLSNVQLSLTGYSFFAEFSGTETVRTEPAVLKVTQVRTQLASATVPSETIFRDLHNDVSLWSSDNRSIHYELYRNGEAAPYESANISNGTAVDVEGVPGQCITVELRTKVTDSPKTVSFFYTVDCTPTPVQTEEQPVLMTNGILGRPEADGFITVKANGSVRYVTAEQIYPAGAEAAEDMPCVVYYIGSLSNIICVTLKP